MRKVCICFEEKAIVQRFPRTSGDAQKEKTVTTQWRFSSKTCKDWGVAQPYQQKHWLRTPPLCLGGLAVCLDTVHNKGIENLKMSESWLLPLEIVIFVVVYYV